MSPNEAPIPPEVEHDLSVVKRGCDELLVEFEFARKLARSREQNIPLRIKLGLDPTAPDIHLGHTVVLNKMRQLQELGHTVIFLIGDFTALIGDPSGRNTTRPPLTAEQIHENAKTYYAQASMVLDPARTEIRYNSEWCDKLGTRGMIELASRYTVARMMERDDFTRRFKSGVPISVHEFLYPLLQGYDSVVLKADLEMGGTDQKFNLLVGRELQKEYGMEPQCILTMPLLEGTDGVDKMSKSKGNYIGITESPDSIFGKLMSISDTLMWRYYELLSFRSMSEIQALQKQVAEGLNPREAKVALAQEIVERFHSRKAAEDALATFEARFRDGAIPENMPEVNVGKAPMGILKILREAGLAASGSEAQRNVEQGGVRVDGQRVADKALHLNAGTYVVQVGKRKFARVTLTE
ncbi:tyrosine--tRNA ligase [Yanghanlia caeni]|uniref:Tyrosine--tRNA ligase n=1 Tax=Yanghanlia caeni TaxID=3064283 RepID=A0ABU1D3W5_9BURK|nr:tyrosine--tRNA ligase [Alcaligenaceae bacterium LG-2]NGR08282.1 tyrosine--tRNA ligase [bacterium SGD-2]HZH57079.1 tyrosine--tRNA ligase [Burkholderiaceae bacterium]